MQTAASAITSTIFIRFDTSLKDEHVVCKSMLQCCLIECTLLQDRALTLW